MTPTHIYLPPREKGEEWNRISRLSKDVFWWPAPRLHVSRTCARRNHLSAAHCGQWNMGLMLLIGTFSISSSFYGFKSISSGAKWPVRTTTPCQMPGYGATSLQSFQPSARKLVVGCENNQVAPLLFTMFSKSPFPITSDPSVTGTRLRGRRNIVWNSVLKNHPTDSSSVKHRDFCRNRCSKLANELGIASRGRRVAVFKRPSRICNVQDN